MTSVPEILYLHLDTRGAGAELSLNGFPLLRAPYHPKALSFQAAAPPFVVPGENELLLRVEPGSRPSLAATETRTLDRSGAVAVAHLVRYPIGADVVPENGTVLCKIEWAAGDQGTALFPIEHRGHVHLSSAFGRWPWQDAPVLALDEALVTEARAVLEAYGRALCRGSAGEFERVIAATFADSVSAFPDWPADEQRDLMRRLVDHYHAAPDPGFSVDFARNDFRLIAGGRVLQCVDDDFQGSLRLRDPDDGSEVRMPLCLARIDGVLRPIR